MSKDNFLPPAGMRDIEPAAAEIRNDVLSAIIANYKKYGFNSVETPCLEKPENLIGKKGGENEKLIFKILKRGEELKETLKNGGLEENDLTDLGLRYDLTVPLARYYARYKDKLPKPFKVFQTGSVWRAERPQKSRYRQFTQCDIDIIGDPTPNCEIELIYVTCKTLAELKIKNFEVRINDRQILKKISRDCGINDDKYGDFLISLDKLDKKSLEDIIEELRKKDFNEEVLSNIRNMFEGLKSGTKNINLLSDDENSDEEYSKAHKSLSSIIDTVKNLLSGINIRFDPTLVRGMDYYTGTIYEVNETNGKVSFGGGGRYNNMVGSFSGQNISACGFSLGFERIIDAFFSTAAGNNENKIKKAALLYSSDKDNYAEIISYCEELRKTYPVVSIFDKQKNISNQLGKLKEIGYTHWGIYNHQATQIAEMAK
ncbi:MAG: histidine--tRNA ligase [Endomicrobium sp.]|jgi:histidyl-tRNA synthetase|nr:histidine--tRNA ligase [Endomicrobium sp.]